MKNFTEAYEQELIIHQQYDAADLAGDEAGKEAARAAHKAWTEAMDAKDQTYARIYRWYSEAQERGNTYIDLNDVIWDKDVPALISSFREYGIEKFTFSSGWSSAVETAWIFLQNGCKLEGLVEINGPHKAFMSDEYEKAHGYLFSIR